MILTKTISANWGDAAGGMGLLLLGAASLAEAYRLYPLRMSAVVGDHTLPAVLGLALAALGSVQIVRAFRTALKVEVPDGPMALRLAAAFGCLLLYGLFLPIAGYALATVVLAYALFRLFGGYGRRVSAVSAAVAVICLYAVFVFWLHMSLPAGTLGF